MNQNHAFENLGALVGGFSYMVWASIAEYATNGILSVVNLTAIFSAINSQTPQEIIVNSGIGVVSSFFFLKACHGLWSAATWCFNKLLDKLRK